jgi:hypothetical protein
MPPIASDKARGALLGLAQRAELEGLADRLVSVTV